MSNTSIWRECSNVINIWKKNIQPTNPTLHKACEGKQTLFVCLFVLFCFVLFCFFCLLASSDIELQSNALCWSSQKCNCAWALPAEVQLRLGVTRRSWQKLFAGKNFVKVLVTAQTQLRSYSEQQRAFGNSNICNWRYLGFCQPHTETNANKIYPRS